MGQHKLFKAQPVFGIQIVQELPSIDAASVIKTVRPTILFSRHILCLKNK